MEEIHDKQLCFIKKRRMQAKLIFNPGSGETGESPVQLMDVITAMQAWKLIPEAYLVEPGCNLTTIVQSTLADGIRMFMVCGGNGTIDIMAGALAGTNVTPGNPVKYVAGIQLIGSLAGVVRWPARRCLGFPVL
jgi:diacylglycerol kinase family enzyme